MSENCEGEELGGLNQRYFVRIDRWHPAKLNQLMNCHWAERNRLKKHDTAIIALSVVGADVPRAEKRRRVSLEITLAPRQRAGDPDSYWKSLLDGLVQCGALVDDSRTWMQLGTIEFNRGKIPGTVIILEDLPQHDRFNKEDTIPVQQGLKRRHKTYMPADLRHIIEAGAEREV